MKIVESYQVPMGNVSPDIFALPCIKMVSKVSERNPIPQYWLYKPNPQCWPFALPTDWICKDSKGKWHVMHDDEYRKICKDAPKEYQPIRGC